jgi:hypothetical protein
MAMTITNTPSMRSGVLCTEFKQNRRTKMEDPYGDGYYGFPDKDEDDPEVRAELMETMQLMGTKPESILTDDQFKKEYEAYLKKNPQVETDDGLEKP